MTDLVGRLARRGESVGCAESLTGGLVVARLIETPGASAVVRGGLVTYATDLKGALLGVDTALLAEQGAVGPEVARQMALGARRVLGADWGLATTGVAGPDAQDGMPVGCVFVAVAGGPADGPSDASRAGSTGADGDGGVVIVERHDLAGSRAEVRSGAVDVVLDLLRRRLDAAAEGPRPSAR